jgi:hypothetical protein
MDQRLYEPDNAYSHGRMIVLSILVLMPLICLLPRWLFQYRWDEHFIVEPQNLEQKPRIPQLIGTIPEPRLQSQPRQDLERFRAQQMQQLQTYGWINRQSGLVRVPINVAMERYLQSSRQP